MLTSAVQQSDSDIYIYIYIYIYMFPRWHSGKESPVNAGGNVRDVGLIHGLGRSSGGWHGNPLQYSCLGNSTDTGAWWATIHGVAKGWTRLSDYTLLSTLSLENIELRPGGLQDGNHCR